MDHKRLALKNIINKIHPIDDITFDLFFSKCFLVSLKKGTTILNVGEQDNYLRFVLKGVVKSYRIVNTKSNSTKESINWVADEGNVACSVVSLFSRKISTEYLETIEDAELLYISFNDLSDLIESHPSICKLISNWCIEYLLMFDKRVELYRHTKPEQRLQLFINSKPQLLNRLSKKEIASYLDITPGTLSVAYHKI